MKRSPALVVITLAGAIALSLAALIAFAGSPGSQRADAGFADEVITILDDMYCDGNGQNCQPNALTPYSVQVPSGDNVGWQWGLGGGGTGNLHTVTECSDATFTNCGAGTDPNGPIDDSGTMDSGTYGAFLFNDGTYYFRCDVHSLEMKGQLIVGTVTTDSPTPSPTPPVTDTPTPTPSLAPTDTPTATATGSDTPTPSTVLVTETPTATPTPTASPSPTATPVSVRGDVNCDGNVDSVDALQVLLHSAHLPTNTGMCPPVGSAAGAGGGGGQRVQGDVDCDGDADSVDALHILRHTANLPSQIPAGCPAIGS